MIQVELVYEQTCRNVKRARERLLRTFVDAGLNPKANRNFKLRFATSD